MKPTPKTLVVGIGNPILTDDGAGIRIALKIKEKLPHLEVIETSEAGLGLLDQILGYERLILIDSIITAKGAPGELYRLDMQDLKPGLNLSSSHGIDISGAFEVGLQLGFQMPALVRIYAMEIADNTTFCETCTPAVANRIDWAADHIIAAENL